MGLGVNERPEPTEALPRAPSQRRLQRPPDFTGGALTHFRHVFLRHGLPGLLLGLVLLAPAALRERLAETLAPALADPLRYAGIGAAILVALLVIGWRNDRRLTPAQVGWTLYLGALSVWEEWVFRVALPLLLVGAGASGVVAVLVANVAFGVMHWFTLRWKALWCLGAFLGGLGLARAMGRDDLAFVVALHWVATFLNTPRPPSGNRPPDG
jgi:hypothetical protein